MRRVQGDGISTHILPDDSSGAYIQVADLAIAHETLGKTDGERRGFDLGVALGCLGAGSGELVHDGGLCSQNGIAILARLLRGNAPSVNDNCDSGEEVRSSTCGMRLGGFHTKHCLLFSLGHFSDSTVAFLVE